MTVFIAAAAVLTLVTLAFLVVPLLRGRAVKPGATQAEASVAVLREQLEELDRDRAAGTIDAASYEEAQRNLKLRILQDAAPEAAVSDRRHAGPAAAIVLLLPIAATGLYLLIGAPETIDAARAPAQAQTQQHETAQLEDMVGRLAKRLEATPDDVQGWTMLARSYRVLGRHEDAVAIYTRLEGRIASDPQRLTEWAESVALAGGGTLLGKPAELVGRALALEPDNGHALALAGAAAFERKDWNAAIRHWERLAKQFPPGSEQGETVARSLAAARDELARAGGAPSVPAAEGRAADKAKPASAAAPAGSFRLTGRVSLAPALAGKASPEDTVFIFARPIEGIPRPFAVLRKQVKDLPVSFTLDSSNAMVPAAELGALGDVVVGARVSRSGGAAAKSGDLQGISRPVKSGASGIQVVIDAALP